MPPGWSSRGESSSANSLPDIGIAADSLPTYDLNLDVEADLEIEPPESTATKPGPPKLTADELETVIRAQSKDVIEEVVWKVVPEMAKQLIEKEIKRLLEEKGNL